MSLSPPRADALRDVLSGQSAGDFLPLFQQVGLASVASACIELEAADDGVVENPKTCKVGSKSMNQLLTLLSAEDDKADVADRVFSADAVALRRQHTVLAGACRYLLSKRVDLSPSPKTLSRRTSDSPPSRGALSPDHGGSPGNAHRARRSRTTSIRSLGGLDALTVCVETQLGHPLPLDLQPRVELVEAVAATWCCKRPRMPALSELLALAGPSAGACDFEETAPVAEDGKAAPREANRATKICAELTRILVACALATCADPTAYPSGRSLQTTRLDANTGLDETERVVGLKATSALVYAARFGTACRLASGAQAYVLRASLWAAAVARQAPEGGVPLTLTKAISDAMQTASAMALPSPAEATAKLPPTLQPKPQPDPAKEKEPAAQVKKDADDLEWYRQHHGTPSAGAARGGKGRGGKGRGGKGRGRKKGGWTENWSGWAGYGDPHRGEPYDYYARDNGRRDDGRRDRSPPRRDDRYRDRSPPRRR